MKVALIVLFAFTLLFSKTYETCYTVQLVSRHNTQKNLSALEGLEYPQECKVMKIGQSVTVRCGCYESATPAKEKLPEYKKRYKKAVLATTYKYRFEDEKSDELLEKTILSPMKTTYKKVQAPLAEEPKKQELKKDATCYTVQLASRQNTTKNLNALKGREYPQECKVMPIGKSLTVRCGCYEKIEAAKSKLSLYKKEYKGSAIARTYKYRFEDQRSERVDEGAPRTLKKETPKKKEKVKTRTKKQYEAKEKVSPQEEELRLMLQVFLYKGDLKSAYKVASIGYSQHPNSYYWNQKMGELSKWTNRSARAMKHLRFVWELDKDPQIEDELILYGSESYQYEEIEPLVVSRAERNPTEENIDLMILVYKKIGYPEKVVDVLESQYEKNPTNTVLLTKALELSLEIGDLELSQRFVKMIEANKPYSKKDASLIARYYYINKEVPKSYESLSYVDESIKTKEEDTTKYFELISDLGWYLQRNEEAAHASKHLLEEHKARLVDYERISFVYQKSDPQLAVYAIKQAYQEYKLSYLFYSYANSAINNKNYEELDEVVKSIDSSSPLQKEALFWIIKSKIYAHYKKSEQEKEALLTALDLTPDNYQIKLTLLWFFMGVHDNENLRGVLADMTQNSALDSSFYLPLASAYFYLNDVNRASYYTQKLLYDNNPITELTQFKFLQAYIYQIQNNEEAFKSSMINIVSALKEEAKENPLLKTQDLHLSNYLRSSMYVNHPDKFEKDLKKAKKYLSKQNYQEISYSWANKNSAYEKSLRIFYKIDKKELWLRFSNALVFQDHSEIENLLDLYLEELSIGDASQALEQDGQVAASQTITFNSLLNNDDNQNAYVHHLDLSKKRSDLLEVKLANHNRSPLLQKYVEINNKTYLQNSFYLDGFFNYYANSTLDAKFLASVPESMKEVGVGLSRFFDRGSVGASFEYHDTMQTYVAASAFSKYRFSTDLKGEIKIAKNINALEGTQLLLGGKKDMLALTLDWQLLNSTSINLLYEKNSYNSQDDVYLGKGDYARITITKQIRNGYPDMRIGAFYDFGKYSETSGSRGVIDRLQSRAAPVLPEDFSNMGVNFAYGMANSGAYTRVWRPYFEVFPYYSKEIDSYTYGFNMGYGGKAWHQDHLSVGASYTDSVSGTGASIFELYVNYQFMYYHP